MAIVISDVERSYRMRLERQTARHDRTSFVTLEWLGSLVSWVGSKGMAHRRSQGVRWQG